MMFFTNHHNNFNMALFTLFLLPPTLFMAKERGGAIPAMFLVRL